MSETILGKVVGDSAYQIAVNEGFVGTEAEWLKSLKGVDGLTVSNKIATQTFTQEDGVITLPVIDMVVTLEDDTEVTYKVVAVSV